MKTPDPKTISQNTKALALLHSYAISSKQLTAKNVPMKDVLNELNKWSELPLNETNVRHAAKKLKRVQVQHTPNNNDYENLLIILEQ